LYETRGRWIKEKKWKKKREKQKSFLSEGKKLEKAKNCWKRI
jgi:hypothetical protein